MAVVFLCEHFTGTLGFKDWPLGRMTAYGPVPGPGPFGATGLAFASAAADPTQDPEPIASLS